MSRYHNFLLTLLTSTDLPCAQTHNGHDSLGSKGLTFADHISSAVIEEAREEFRNSQPEKNAVVTFCRNRMAEKTVEVLPSPLLLLPCLSTYWASLGDSAKATRPA